MRRTPSRLAQLTFDLSHFVHSTIVHPRPSVKLFGLVTRRLTDPIARIAGRNHFVESTLYGRTMRMPSEHPLSEGLIFTPHINRPLALTVQAIANLSVDGADIPVIDVGANIGETIAVIEQKVPERCSYLCIDADPDLIGICQHNYRSSSRVEAEQHFIGDIEGATVRLVDDGRANATTKLVDGNPNDLPRLVRLDTIGAPFANAHGKLSLIKVDVEGLDFSVLRSAEALLRKYEPCLYFEWFPELLKQSENNACNGFDYLRGLGYTHFVFFNNVGYYHSKLINPDPQQLEALSAVTSQDTHMPFFDVFASTSDAVCEELTRLNINLSQ